MARWLRALAAAALALGAHSLVHAQGAEGEARPLPGALDFAHGVTALQEGRFDEARSDCAAAARSLEGEPGLTAALGRAQLCVARALIGLGLRGRAHAVLDFAVTHLSTGSQERFVADFEAAKALQLSLAGEVRDVPFVFSPRTICQGEAPPQVTVEGHGVDAGALCRGETLRLERRPTEIRLEATGFEPLAVQVDLAAESAVHLTPSPDADHPRWLVVRLSEPGAVLQVDDERRCASPCEVALDRGELRGRTFVVIDAEDGGVDLEVPGALPDGPVALERDADSNLPGWIWLGASVGLVASGIGVLAAGASEQSVALGVTGLVLAILSIPAGIIGVIDVVTPPRRTVYRFGD